MKRAVILRTPRILVVPTILAVSIGLVVIVGVGQARAQDSGQANPQRKAAAGTGVKAIVTPALLGRNSGFSETITYDNNTPFQRDPQVDGTVGNRFQFMPDPHCITTLTFRLAGNYGGSIVASIWDPGGGTAQLLRRFLVSGVPTGTAATGVTIMAQIGTLNGTMTAYSPIVSHSGPFIAAIRNTAYTGLQCTPPASALNSTCDGVALTEGATTIGEGLHGIRLAFTSTAFVPNVTALGSAGIKIPQNAIMRATGANLPVELMSFAID